MKHKFEKSCVESECSGEDIVLYSVLSAQHIPRPAASSIIQVITQLPHTSTLHSTMADTAAPAKKVATKKVSKPKVAAAHPPFANMCVAAIKALKERNGSSRKAILKYIVENYKVGDAAKAQVRVKLAMRKMIAAKKVVAGGAAGKKGAGSFKLPAAEKAEKKKPAAKKPAAKKAAKKPAAKKAAKKHAAKKVAKKHAAKKPAAKKPAAKKPAAKKPAAKKPAKKAAAKK